MSINLLFALIFSKYYPLFENLIMHMHSYKNFKCLSCVRWNLKEFVKIHCMHNSSCLSQTGEIEIKMKELKFRSCIFTIVLREKDKKFEFHVVYKLDMMESVLLNILYVYSVQVNGTLIQLHLLRPSLL
jgi:hypothetical protein